jgi:hypothetical protein
MSEEEITEWQRSEDYRQRFGPGLSPPLTPEQASDPDALRTWVHASGPSPVEILLEQARDRELRPDTRQRAAIALCAFLYGRPESRAKLDVSGRLTLPKLPGMGKLSDTELEALETLLAKAGAEGVVNV